MNQVPGGILVRLCQIGFYGLILLILFFLNQYFGTLRPETTFAHTSPVYLLVDGQAIRSPQDATYFIHYLDNAQTWLDQSGSFPSDTAKAEVLAAFETGKQAFEVLMK